MIVPHTSIWKAFRPVLVLTMLSCNTYAVEVKLCSDSLYLISFEVKGCGKISNVGDIWMAQCGTVNLDDFKSSCEKNPGRLKLNVFYNFFGWKAFKDQVLPWSLFRIKDDVWFLQVEWDKRRSLITRKNISAFAWTPWGHGPYIRDLVIDTDMTNVDLSNADLHNIDLRRINFHGANLKGANLKNTDLTSANLTGADLSGADLSKAVLIYVRTDNDTKCPNGQVGPCW